jgi:hypothetical protein
LGENLEEEDVDMIKIEPFGRMHTLHNASGALLLTALDHFRFEVDLQMKTRSDQGQIHPRGYSFYFNLIKLFQASIHFCILYINNEIKARSRNRPIKSRNPADKLSDKLST